MAPISQRSIFLRKPDLPGLPAMCSFFFFSGVFFFVIPNLFGNTLISHIGAQTREKK
jgi:hypothetical protein